jgi:hypothetical protein
MSNSLVNPRSCRLTTDLRVPENRCAPQARAAIRRCKFRSFRQAISEETGRRFPAKPTGRFGPKRHPVPKAFGRTAAA